MEKDLLKLDEKMFNTLKDMWESEDPEHRTLFKGIVVNNLDLEDFETKYWAHKLVTVIHPSLNDSPLFKKRGVEMEAEMNLKTNK